MKQKIKKQRAVIIFGAGASVELGVPATIELTELIEQEVLKDQLMQIKGCDRVFLEIKKTLSSYLNSPSSVHFENIYHCVHELLHFNPKAVGYSDEFKPLLMPFLKNDTGLDRKSLRPLERKIIESIYSIVSSRCENPRDSLMSLRDFLTALSNNYTTRIYSTNYDDFPLQAIGDSNYYYTGFMPIGDGISKFSGEDFWANCNKNAFFHLHGSVHMSYLPSSLNRMSETTEFGELFWFQDRARALSHSGAWLSGFRRMDGSGIERGPIITGLDKLSRVQQPPFCYYYAALSRDMIEANAIIVIGSGLGDLHINTWLHEARKLPKKPPLIFVDYWPEGWESGRTMMTHKNIEMSLSLMISDHEPSGHDLNIDDGWTISKKGKFAVWDKGFMAFLNNQDSFLRVIEMI